MHIILARGLSRIKGCVFIVLTIPCSRLECVAWIYPARSDVRHLRFTVWLFLVTGQKKHRGGKKNEKPDRWCKSAAASETPISIWQVHSTQTHNLGVCECKYVQAGWHECTSAIHHPQDADPSPSPSCLLPTPASQLLLSFLREISRKDQFACLFLLVEPVIGLGGWS